MRIIPLGAAWIFSVPQVLCWLLCLVSNKNKKYIAFLYNDTSPLSVSVKTHAQTHTASGLQQVGGGESCIPFPSKQRDRDRTWTSVWRPSSCSCERPSQCPVTCIYFIQHVKSIARTKFFSLRSITIIRPMLSSADALRSSTHSHHLDDFSVY